MSTGRLCNHFSTLAIIRSLLSPNSSTQLHKSPCWRGRSADLYMFECAWCLHTHTVQLWRPEMERKSSGRGDHNGMGVKFICTQKWCMCRSQTTQLDPVSVNTDTPPTLLLTHAHTADEETDSRLTLFFLFSPLLSLSAAFAVTRFIAFLWQSIAQITGLKFLSHEGRRWGQGCL